MLGRLAGGFGTVALAGMLADEARPHATDGATALPHFRPRARRVIFLFMNGGPSQVDTFDPKPELFRWEGKRLPVLPENTNKLLGKPRPLGNAFPSPWKFQKYGACGMEVSELFPEVARCVDDLCLIRTVTCDSFFHAQGTLEMMTGSGLFLRPSIGSWLLYGLGTENRNLPGFVVLGKVNSIVDSTKVFSSAFLPAEFQGTQLASLADPIPNLKPREGQDEQRAQFDLLRQLNGLHHATRPETQGLAARIESFELAFRMQTVAAEAFDLAREPAAMSRLYGTQDKATGDFGQKCLLARRLVERGVRFVVVNHTDWDQHSNLFAGHARNARQVDQPIAGLLQDLKQRGLLDDTLVIWGGEFGRTPNTEGKDGRDHNTAAFSMWLAGGGVKRGHIHGVTDEFGAYIREGRVHIHDLHATILHLMGIHHERLTFRYGGRDFRLTDVFGNVVHEIVA
jgi:hypothetical protein